MPVESTARWRARRQIPRQGALSQAALVAYWLEMGGGVSGSPGVRASDFAPARTATQRHRANALVLASPLGSIQRAQGVRDPCVRSQLARQELAGPVGACETDAL